MEFLAPNTAFEEAAEHLPLILTRRGLPERDFLDFLASLSSVIAQVEPAAYRGQELEARRRLAGRDEEDWPVLAVALTLDSPIWTEDFDFFGCGVPTWTSDRVETYLALCAGSHDSVR